ncbi:MAG: tetratricopeptide repeat protein [Deltaproteobacteria bacterium]|nr:tetratricopeptide repeat protein [Deltaproteobacteria bacterium]
MREPFEIPEFLVDRLRRRRCVLCAGLGLGRSAGLGFPTWSALAGQMGDWLRVEGRPADEVSFEELRCALADGDLFTVVGYLARRLGRDYCVARLRESYPGVPELPPLYRALARLPFRGVISTGFDTVLGRPFGIDEDDGPPVFTHIDGAAIRAHRGPFFLAAHGELSRPATLILSRTDLRRAVADPDYSAFCRELFGRYSLVFVGFAPADPDFIALLERHFGGAPRALLPHIMLADGVPPLEVKELKAAHGVVVVPVGGDLPAFVAALADRVASAEAASRPDPDDLQGWLQVLQTDASDGGAWEALAALEASLRERRDHQQLVELLLGRLDHERRPTDRRRTLSEVAGLFEHELNDPERALTTLLACLREDPDDDQILAGLERVAARTGRWGEVVGDYAQTLHDAMGTPAAAHWLRLGRLYEEKLGQLDFALSAYERAVALDPTLVEAHAARLAVLRRAERWRALVEALAAQLRIETDPARQTDLWVNMADVHETRLDEPAQAATAYQRALELEPESPEILASLERLLRRLGYWRDLCEVLRRRAALAFDPEVAASLRHEIGEIRAARLGDAAGAVAAFTEVLAAHPERLPTLRALERLQADSGNLVEATRILERLTEVADGRDERLALLKRLAARRWELHDEAGELLVYEKIRELAPDHPDALDGLARLLGPAGRHQELAAVLERAAELAPDPARRRAHRAALAGLAERELGDLAQATQIYEMLAAEGDDDALAALMRLHERQGNHEQVAAVALRRAETQPDATARAELVAIAGVMAAEHLGDLEAAEARFAQALELNDAHLPSRLGLVAIYRSRGDYLHAARLLDETAARTQNRLQRARFLHEAGSLYLEHLDDEEQAAELFARVLEIDPEHVAAAALLAERAWRRGEWAQAEPLLEILVRKTGQKDPELKPRLLARLAACCAKLGQPDRALRHYRAARGLSPTDRDVLGGLAALLHERVMAATGDEHTPRLDGPVAEDARPGGRDEAREAVDSLQTLLVNHGDDLSEAERLGVLQGLGQLHVRLGQGDRALQLFDAALALEPQDRTSLEASLPVAQARQDWPRVIDVLERLIEIAPEDEQARLLERLGDVYIDQLEDPVEAAKAYEAATQSGPRRRAALTKLMDLYSQQKAWVRAVEVIEALCHLVDDAPSRARYHHAAGVICQEEIGDFDRALKFFNQALETAPEDLRPFELLERIFVERDDWKGLAKAYGKHLKRLPTQGLESLRRGLWLTLGEICLKRLGETENAIAAFEVVATLDPDNREHQRRLAALYLEAGPDARAKAIDAHQALVRRDPGRADAYHTLFRLYSEVREWDRAFCVAAALVTLQEADADELKRYEERRPTGLSPPRAALSEDLWKKAVMHPDEDRFVGAAFSRLGGVVALLRAKEPEAFGLRRRDRIDAAADERAIVKLFRRACETLAVPLPDLYLRPGPAWSVQVANTGERTLVRPALVVGAPDSGAPPERDLLFDLGSRLAFTRPERYLRHALPTARDVEAALRGMLQSLDVDPPAPGMSDPAEADRIAAEIRRSVSPQVREPLGAAARKWAQGHSSLDVAAWIAAADLTAGRAGLIACLDLETAVRMLTAATAAASPLRPHEQVHDLLVYAVSDEYASVRRHLGVTVAGPA